MRRLRRLTRLVFGRPTSGLFRLLRLGGTRIDYAREVGDGLNSSSVAIALNWIGRAFVEARPAVWEPNPDAPAQEREDFTHPLKRLLARPNPYFTGPLLWWATVVDWHANGDAYWLKLRNRNDSVAELWWVPSWQIAPAQREGAREFITHYVYTVDGVEYDVDVRDVVHFRYGSDPQDPRRGLSPLKSVLREVFTDDEAANFTAALLRNSGVPGLMVSPDSDNAELPEGDADEAKAQLKAKFTGDKRGEPIIMSVKTKVEQFGFSPEQLELRNLRRVPEERVSAAVGIPAVVLGFGAGLERSTFTNFAEAREAAYEQGIIPMQVFLSEDVRFQLLVDFETETRVHSLRFGFDLSKVRVLQEDEYRKWQRYDVGIRGGWIQVAEGRQAVGQEVTAADRIYLRQMALTQVPADGGEPTPLSPPRGTGGTNGNGAVELNGHHADSVAERVVERLEASERLRDRAHSRR